MSFWNKLRSFFGVTGQQERKEEENARQSDTTLPDNSPESAQLAERTADTNHASDSPLVEAPPLAAKKEGTETDALPILKITPFEVPRSSYRSPSLTAYLPTRLAELIEQAQLVDQSRAISPKLLVLALEDGFLTTDRALSLARNQPTPVLRADALIGLLSWQPPRGVLRESAEMAQEAWLAVRAIPVATERVKRLAKLQHADARESALAAIDTIHDPVARVNALAEVGEWSAALKTCAKIGSQFEQANVLLELIDQLPDMWLERASKLVQALDEYGSHTINAACALIPRLSRPLMKEFRQWVSTIPDELTQVAIGSCVAYNLSGEELAEWVERLREVVEKVEYPSRRITMSLHLLPHLPSEEHHPTLMRLLALARPQENDLARAESLGSIALCLPSKEREPVFAEAMQALNKVNDGLHRHRLWGEWAKGLCKHADISTMQSGLIMMGNVREIFLRSAYLEEVTPKLVRLSPKQLIEHIQRLLPQPLTQSLFWQQALPHLQPAHLAAIWSHVNDMQDRAARSSGLIALAPYLPEQRKNMISQALAAAKQAPRQASLPVLLAAIAKRVPSERQPLLKRANKALAEWDSANQVYILADMLAQLGDAAPDTLWAQATNNVQQIDNLTSKSLAYQTLLAQAPAQKQSELARQALELVLHADHAFMRQQRLLGLLPYLPDNQVRSIWLRSRPLIDDMQLPALLSALAPRMSPRLFSTVFEDLQKLPAHRMRVLAEGLATLMPYLSAEEAQKASELAESIRFPAPRLLAQAAIATQGPLAQKEPARSDTLNHLLTEALDISLPASRVEALAHITTYLSDPQRSEVLHKALRVLLTIDDGASRAHQLRALLPLTTAARADEMLHFVRQVGEDRLRAHLITTLLPHLPPKKVGALLPFVSAFSDMNDYNTVLSALIPHLPKELLIEALLLIRQHAQNPTLHSSLNPLAKRWREMSQSTAIQSTAELMLTLDAFAQGGTMQLYPALTALLPLLEKEGGRRLLTHLVRLVDGGE